MKTKGILLTIGMTILTLTSLAQKSSQADLPNEFYAGYGAGSIYYFTGLSKRSYHNSYDYNSDAYLKSAGTFLLGYTRNVNRVFSIGVIFSYMPANTEYSAYEYGNSGSSGATKGTATDNIMSGITRITFSYLSRPSLRLYSGVAIGITVDCGTVNFNGETDTRRVIYPAGQLTMFGVRFGRAFGGFVEMGFGTNGIITGGLSYKIKD